MISVGGEGRFSADKIRSDKIPVRVPDLRLISSADTERKTLRSKLLRFVEQKVHIFFQTELA